MFISRIISAEKTRLSLLIRGISLLWILAKIFSYKTWIADRKYPVIAPAEFLQSIPSIVHLVLFLVAMIALCVVLVYPKKYIIALFLLFEMLSCALDTVRWQPWEFMYICIFLLFIFNQKKSQVFFLLLHLFICSVYIFSGLHKINRGFLSVVWVQMVLQKLLGISIQTIVDYKLFFVGLLIPFTELFLGIALLFSKHKKIIRNLLILMHIIILTAIGPLGLNYNPIVWGWNIAMIFMLLIVYEKPTEKILFKTVKLNLVWMILWFFMPFFSFFGKWYQYFSSSLYTGKEKQIYVYISKKNKQYQEFAYSDLNSKEDFYIVNLQNWALEEIKSAPLPENEINQKIIRFLKLKLGKDCRRIILFDPKTGKQTKL